MFIRKLEMKYPELNPPKYETKFQNADKELLQMINDANADNFQLGWVDGVSRDNGTHRFMSFTERERGKFSRINNQWIA